MGEEEFLYLYKLPSISPNPPYVINVHVMGKGVTFEIDTAAGLTVISEEIYNQQFSSIPLKKCEVKIKTYTDERIHVAGKMVVYVNHNDRTYEDLPLTVLKDSGVNLT